MQSPHTNLSVMKLYILIQRFLGRKYVHYFVLFFILISIAAIIGSSYEEMAAYRLPLFGVTYVSSFVFLVEYIVRILSAPALYPGRKAVKARLKYTFSFYGFVDFVAVLPCILTYIYWDTEVVHVIILPYIFIIFKLIRHSRSFRIIGRALSAVKRNLKLHILQVSSLSAFQPSSCIISKEVLSPKFSKISETEYGGLSSRLPP